MLEKELLSVISLHKRFSLASVGVWLFLSILQLFLMSEMFKIDEAYFLFVMSIPMLIGSGVIHLYRKFSVRTSLFSSVDIDIRLSLLLLVAAAMLQTFGMSDVEHFTPPLILVLMFLPGVLCLLAFPAIFTRVKLNISNRFSCRMMDHFLFTALMAWLAWVIFTMYIEEYLLVGVFSNMLVGCVPIFVNFVNRDVQCRMSAILESEVFNDELTGLGNRKALYRGFDNVKREITDEKSLIMMIVDIDYFKQYNDFYGHMKGDECLVYVSRTLEEIFPDLKVIRYGGEEFVIFGLIDNHKVKIFENSQFMKSWANGQMTMDCEHTSSPIKLLSLSAGYGIFTASEVKVSNAKKLITLTDDALYEAKKDRQKIVKVSGIEQKTLSK